MRTSTPRLEEFLQRLRSRQQRLWLAAAWAGGVGCALVIAAMVFAVETLAWLPPGPRHALIILAVVLLFLLVGVLLLGTALLPFLRKTPSDKRLALRVGTDSSAIQDRLLNALELSRQEASDRTSEELKRLAVDRMTSEIKTLNPADFVERNLLRVALRFSLAVIVVIALLYVPFRRDWMDAAERLANPHETYLKPGTVLLDLDLVDTVRVVQGDSLVVFARATNARPSLVQLVLDDHTGLTRQIPCKADSLDSMRFRAVLPRIDHSLAIFAKAGRTTSDTVHVQVITRPRVARLMVAIQPPAYTELQSFDLPVNSGDLTVLPGSSVRVSIETSRTLVSATLIHERENGEIKTVVMNVDNDRANGRFLVISSGQWHMDLVAEDGVTSEVPINWQIQIVDDQTPVVTILNPEDGALIPESMGIPLIVNATDDFAISRMALRYRVYSPLISADSVSADEYGSSELPFSEVDPGRVQSRILWGLADFPIIPGDEIHYFVEAWDNDAWKGAKKGVSELRRLVLPTLDELYDQTFAEEQSVGEDLTEMLERAKETQEKLEETLEKLRSNPDDMSWEEAQAVQNTLEQQEEMLEQLQKVAENLEQLTERAEEHDLLSEELVEKYQKLQELIEEVASPELKASMQKLQEAIENLDGEKIRQALEEMNFDQEEMIEDLDRSLSILEQLAAERKLDELAKRAEEIAERQQQLHEQSQSADKETLSKLGKKQKELQEDLERLAEQTASTSEELAESFPEMADSLASVSEEMKEGGAQQQMSEAQRAMQNGNKKQSQQSSQKASEKMEQLAQRMRSAQQQMVQQGMEEMNEKMDHLFSGILLLSRQQEALLNKSATLTVGSPRYRALAATQEALQQSLAMLKTETLKLMGQSFFVAASVANGLERAEKQMDTVLDHYTARNPRNVAREQSGVNARLHEALLSLLQSQQQMQQSASSTGYNEMMQQLQQASQQQQAINQQSQGMMPMPGQQNPSQPGGQQLANLAARQKALAQKMRGMEKETQSMQEMLGSLDGMGNAMEEVAKDLENRTVTKRTRKLQERILQRLLDSQRSLQQREKSRERTGKVLDRYNRSVPPEFLPDQGENMLRQRLLRALEGDYAQPWKNTIRTYYRSLEKQPEKGNTKKAKK